MRYVYIGLIVAFTALVLLFKVHQHGKGACHTGARTCFYRRFGSGV